MNISEKITSILNYYTENPNCDPNMFEYVGLCYDMVQYLATEAPNYGIYSSVESNEVSMSRAVYEKFKILSQQFEQKLLGNDLEITKESPLYKLYSDLSMGVGTYSAYPDTKLLQKLGGVALFVAQKKREVKYGLISDFIYDNATEFDEIQKLDNILHDPHAGGHYVDGNYVEPTPSARRLLVDEITEEYQKMNKTR